MTLRAAPIAMFLLAIAIGASAQPMGKSKEYRSLNTELYKISIQKDGQLDVFLATDTPVIIDAFPMIWMEGEREPERLKTSGRWTERLAVEDRLGQGQGVVHQHDGWEWSLRAYPTRPYFAVQLAYTNQSNKPVRIKALLPWCVGLPGKGMILLGPGTSEARALTGTASGTPAAAQGEAQSPDVIAVVNATTGQSLIAGFVTQDYAHGLLEVGAPAPEKKDSPSSLRRFRAMSAFDDAVELAPGETVRSEVLYLSIAEPDPVVALQRYARAVQVVNNKYGPDQNKPLHAWVLTDPAQSGPALAERLRALQSRVPLSSVGYVLIGSPEGSALRGSEVFDLSNVIRETGYIPLQWEDLGNASAIPGRQGQFSSFSGILRIRPEGTISQTKILIQKLQQDLGDNAWLLGAEPSLGAATLFDGVITDAADRLYLTPQPARHTVFLPPNTGNAAHAHLVAAAMLGCGLLLPLPDADDHATPDLVARLLPSPSATTRPVDLFASRHPGIFHLHNRALDGDVHVIVIANWNRDLALSTPIPFARFGFVADAYYTVYDFWQRQYLGTASNTLNISIPPGETTVLVCRPFLGHPMLVSTGENLAQDYPALRRADWDAQARTLTVEFADAATTHAARRFTLAVPAPYHFANATAIPSGPLNVEPGKSSVSIEFSGAPAPTQGFVAQFDVKR